MIAVAAPDSAATNASRFTQLLHQEWEYELQSSPETATAYGDRRFNAQLGHLSPAFFHDDLQRRRDFQAQFASVSPDSLSASDRLNRDLMLRRLQLQISELEAKTWEMPVDQMNGVHLGLAQLPDNTPFDTAADYRAYAQRLHQVPRYFREVETTLRAGIADGLVPPRYLLEQSQKQMEAIAQAPLAATPFAKPLARLPAAVPASEQPLLRAEIETAITKEVQPAYAKLARFLANTYVPAGRREPGIWAVPGGGRYYQTEIRVMTTTGFTPAQFHAIGERQVRDITAEMLVLARQLGYADLASLNAAIARNPDLHGRSGEQIFNLYRQHVADMRTKMPALFGRQPKAPLDVVRMDDFRAPHAPPADYSPGSADGIRPGRINVNEYNANTRLLLNLEGIAYHEGIPGHHQQIALGQELTGLPEFRRHSSYNAFQEGWALYSERLGKEVGLYRDPYSDYGRLQNDMWRAVRLVVDTGVHAQHWSRADMIRYFHEHTAMDETNIESEVDRYIAWPAQALGYKAGQIKILDLRERARQALGPRFDLRAFHDAVLEEGALPLDVLDQRMTAWIASRKVSGTR